MCDYFDIAIVGSGAAGITAAISACRLLKKSNFKYKVALIEKGKIIGKKILVTGNGKCNITNMNISKEFYYGTNISEINKIIKRFGYSEANKFLASLGLTLKSDSEKRVYPVSLQASCVRDAMIEEVEHLKISQFCELQIKFIKSLKENMFEINSNDINIRCKKLIICTGGKSAPFSGYDGDGYNYLSYFNHSVSNVFPALSPIICKSSILRDLKGVRWACKASLLADGQLIKSETGEVQFNESNLSGICIFQISRLASEFISNSKINGKAYKSVTVSLDLFPDFKLKDLEVFLLKRVRNFSYMSAENFMAGIINKKLGIVLLKKLKIYKKLKCAGDLNLNDIKRLTKTIKNLEFNVDGIAEFKQAQVTAGGVKLCEFNTSTLESKKKAGLYCAGEILDADGVCGGYNLHWAWATGYIAGTSAAASIISEKDKK